MIVFQEAMQLSEAQQVSGCLRPKTTILRLIHKYEQNPGLTQTSLRHGVFLSLAPAGIVSTLF